MLVIIGVFMDSISCMLSITVFMSSQLCIYFLFPSINSLCLFHNYHSCYNLTILLCFWKMYVLNICGVLINYLSIMQ